MTKAKKFGAFAGVFTPSLLTILGVIMYMRLGWVVGQAGLINTILIILLAHVISLSTGLSISSIATDKKIKAGGIYYILSRSLGLPMGGAIGISLFIGTALSISLYLIGFAESFLSIDPIREFLGLEQNIFGYQVIGTVAILILVMMAFISTSFAIKAQYYILGAIGLSLVSIFAGFYFYPDFKPEKVLLAPAENGISLELLFAIFFPAVTGFTAGVAMSGDLKDPKKSIPYGTMSAILVGFLVYVSLAVAIAIFVNRDMLLNDTNFIMKIALFSPLVVAGIWGATLSSALGGILGGPRILQAMSSDRISPRIFARGYGVNNEPRNALILIFIIAEVGILIGELNVVAGVVSMFYLASYGFINISYFLESWASADFRPSFKINRYIGLIGFIAAFGVMFKLNMGYMIAALVLMLGIYFILKRKQLKLDFGDVWHSVWSSLMRTALEKMDNAEQIERNWLPNIILFSGESKKRPHLLELGKSFVGRHGILSNFDLIENPDEKVLFPKNKQSIPGALSEKGVFTRRQTVNDIYNGIDMIARTYGFSGLEPNTVMMGWARQTQKPARFAALLKTLYSLDFNVVLLGYDKRYGYGDYKTIDIWFRDKSNIGTLALNLSKLLLLSEKWENAQIRVLVVNSQNDRSDDLYHRLQNFLESMRVDAKLRILNNQIEQKPFYEIVEEESRNTALVFLNIPEIKPKMADEFIEQTNILLERIGTVVLLNASSSFKKIKFGLDEKTLIHSKALNEVRIKPLILNEPELPVNKDVAQSFKDLSDKLISASGLYIDMSVLPVCKNRLESILQTSDLIMKTFAVLENKLGAVEGIAKMQILAQLKSGLLIRFGKIVEEQKKQANIEKDEYLLGGLQVFFEGTANVFNKLTHAISIWLNHDDMNRVDPNYFADRSFRIFRNTFSSKKLKEKGIPYTLRYREIIRQYFPLSLYRIFIKHHHEFGAFNIEYIYSFQRVLYTTVDALLYIEKNIGNSEDDMNAILKSSKSRIKRQLEELKKFVKNFQIENRTLFLTEITSSLSDITHALDRVPANNHIKRIKRSGEKEKRKQLLEMPMQWETNHRTLLRYLNTESVLMLFEYRMYRIFTDHLREMKNVIRTSVFEPVETIVNSVLTVDENKIKKNELIRDAKVLNWNDEKFQLEIKRIRDKSFSQVKILMKNLPERVELFSNEANNELSNIQFSNPETIKVPLSRVVDFVIQDKLTAPFYQSSSNLVLNLSNSMERVNDAARLIRLSLAEGMYEETINNTADANQFSNVAGHLQKINDLLQEMKEARNRFESEVNNNLRQVHDELHLLRLIKTRDRGPLSQSSKEASQKFKALNNRIKQIGIYLEKKRAGIWHSESRARLFAQKISGDEDSNASVVARVINLKEQVSPIVSVWQNIPFYYQQLFNSKYNYQPEFFFGRTEELKDASQAISRYFEGHHGALLVHGEPQSGKTFFIEYLIHSFLGENPVYTIQPPIGGTTNADDFLSALNEATNQKGSSEEILGSLEIHSVILLDDLELWWEKSDCGGEILEFIFNLISKFNSRIIFILSANTASLEVIRKQFQIDYLFIQSIGLNPMNSGALEDIILFRHRTSGFDLQIDKSSVKGINMSVQAKIFNRIFRFSRGNSGAALHCWVASIIGFKDEVITVKSIRNVDDTVLSSLPSEAKVILLQLLLHKRASVDKLQRITLLPMGKLQEILDYLIRCGLINRKAGDLFEPDKFLLPLLNKYLFTSFDKPGKIGV